MESGGKAVSQHRTQAGHQLAVCPCAIIIAIVVMIVIILVIIVSANCIPPQCPPLILDKSAANLRCRPLRRSFRAGSSPSDEQPVVRAGFISTAFAGHTSDEEMQNHNCGGLRSK